MGDGPPNAHEEWRASAAAYALDVLDAADRKAFASHLETCLECRALVASYTPVLANLGLAAEPVRPPESLRARTLARAVHQPRQTSPTAPTSTMTGRAPLEARAESTASRTARQAASWWLLAASLMAAVGLGIYAWSLRQQVGVLRTIVSQASAEVQAVRAELANVRRESTRLGSVVNVLTAVDLHRVDLAGQAQASAASARAFVSQSHGLMFSAEHLPALAAGHVYQVWVLAPTPVSAGVVTPAPDGTATATMPMPNDVTLAAITAVAVTEEPSPQGSLTPTMPILLVGNVGR
ncbi:MAG TPA: anti-sigma factor [Vicinamibacterales bacterium]